MPATHTAPDSVSARPVGSLPARICAFMLVLYALYYARSLIIPVITAIVLYLTLRPIVRQGKRIGIPAAVGAAGILISLLAVLALGTYLVLQPAQAIAADAPQHMAVVRERLSFLTARLEQVDQATEDLTDTADQDPGAVVEEEPVPVEIRQPDWVSGWSYLSGTGNVISFMTICAALLYFLLAAGDDLLRSVMRSLPDFTARRKLVETIQAVQEGLGSYLAKITIINACLGISVGLAMWLWQMPTPVLWGVMAFAFNFIPIVGAIVGATVIFLVALVAFAPAYYAFAVTGTFLALTSLEGQFITPSILGRTMRISPVLVFISIVFWGWMWGIMGVFLSIPILIATRMACEHYEGLMPLAYILGAEEPEAEGSTATQPATTTSIAVATGTTRGKAGPSLPIPGQRPASAATPPGDGV